MPRSQIAVVDYGMGNLHSVSKALEHAAPDAEVLVTSDASTIDAADRVVFPGVGAIRDCVGELVRRGLDASVRKAASEKPLLGICVGMQALMDFSEENAGTDCLGIIPGRVKWFGAALQDVDGSSLKVPHMGWNTVGQQPHPLWNGIDNQTRFYFVHSYYVQPADAGVIAGQCEYGVSFAAAIAFDNVFAVQFHPEKSHLAGLQLLANFAGWSGNN